MSDWWGSTAFAEGEARRWCLDGLDMFVLRRRDAWFSQAVVGADSLAPVRAEAIDWQPGNSDADVVQYIVGDPDDAGAAALELRAALPDRPLVSRPREPFVLGPGRTATLYVGVPLWVALAVGGVVFAEYPTRRLAETWFGPSTITGELCYASRMHCHTSVDELEADPHRAITPLELINDGTDRWTLDRVALPTPILPLWHCEDGRLWTSGLSVRRDATGVVGDVRASTAAPDGIDAERLAEPRTRDDRSLLGRFYGRLF